MFECSVDDIRPQIFYETGRNSKGVILYRVLRLWKSENDIWNPGLVMTHIISTPTYLYIFNMIAQERVRSYSILLNITSHAYTYDVHKYFTWDIIYLMFLAAECNKCVPKILRVKRANAPYTISRQKGIAIIRKL